MAAEQQASGSRDMAGDQNINDQPLDEAPGNQPSGAGGNQSEMETGIRNRRKQLRNKFTRTINRVKGALNDGETDQRKLNKEMEEIRRLYQVAGDAHSELYDLVPEDQTRVLDQWESTLANEFYNIEIQLEDYFKTLNQSDIELPSFTVKSRATTGLVSQNETGAQFNLNNIEPIIVPSQEIINTGFNEVQAQVPISPSTNSNGNSQPVAINQISDTGSASGLTENSIHYPIEAVTNIGEKPFDGWIDDLIEFQETNVISHNLQNLSITDALYRLEASRDIPTVQLSKFNGSPLEYVEFIEKFKIHIHDKPNLSDDMRMIQLRMHVIGEAGRAISGLGSGGKMYATALKLIKEQFGQSSVIARAVINRLTKGAKIATSDRQALRDFSFDILNSLAICQQMRYFADINANDNLRQIIKRLPDHLIRKWKSIVSDIRDKGQMPTLGHISDFLRKAVRSEFDPDFGDLDRVAGRFDKSNEFRGPTEKKKGIHAAHVNSGRSYKCFICQEGHRVMDCPTFIDSSVGKRFELCMDNRLCFSCLMRGHSSHDCRTKKQCPKDACKHYHHVLLHKDPLCASSASSVLDQACLMPVVRVLFRANNGKCREGNVLIDSGAGTTIIRKEFSRILGLQGKREGLDLSVVGGQRFTQSDSRRVKFWMQNVAGGEEFPIEAHELDRTIISVPALNKKWLNSFPHLKDIDFSQKAGPIDLILGVQYSHLHTEEEVRQGKPFDPVGKLSRLGWYVIGPDKGKSVSPVKEINFVEKLDMEKFYQFETLGIQSPDCSCSVTVMSPDDKLALKLLESSCKKEGDRYVVGLPWKRNPIDLPNNYALAESRLLSLEKSLMRNNSKAELYDKAIVEYERNNWAEKMSEDEAVCDENQTVYYLPHHGVYRPDKVSTPLRVVFDPACSFQGVSLNSFLLKGPCLIGNLYAVLLRFRENYVAFTGDISKMFLQICLPESDTHVHRFLWRNMDTSRKPDVYRLLRVTFGDKSSPDMASFVLLKIAKENQDKFPNASLILSRDRYMDDLIHSCDSVEEARLRISELDEVLATGSFQIKEWICSADLEGSADGNVSLERETKEINLDREDVKTLGVIWNPVSDTIKFVVKDMFPVRFTKRTVLSKMSTLFDPLGLATAVTITARMAMQDVWRCKRLDWDDPLPSELVSIWQQVFQGLTELNGKEFPRCIKPNATTGEPEIHVFADASGKAYGAVSYVRWQSEDGVDVRIISAKARVAPLKQTTIPRLELMAALVASRLAKTIVDELSIKPICVTLWSDSQIVLHWLKSESSKLKAFAGIRVAEIQATWDPSCWRFVPTSLNPADDLTRGISADDMDGRWMHGPNFLRCPKEEWPWAMVPEIVNDVEVKKINPVAGVVQEVPTIDCMRYSSWRKLLRVTALCFKFIEKLKSKITKGGPISSSIEANEISISEKYWIQVAQRDLRDWEHQYRDLAPFMKDGIVRVGGRLRNAPLEYEHVHPALLPASHPIATMIMRDIHLKMGHVGAERTLCESRRKYWIVRGRVMAKAIVRKCVICRKLRGGPHATVMADLPSERLGLFSPPFSVTGVDLFGPFKLKYGRNKTTKAWGAVFTCATIRAMHLEVVDGLSTAAFLHSLRRFAARHGWPKTMISDNGSNFVGAQAELRKLVQEGRKRLEDFSSLHQVRWVFNTPLSPHQGGFFESIVKLTKRALQVAIGEQCLTWNEMTTAFAEAECLINSRPLGYAPDNPNDPQPITPNHFILGRASSEIPSGPFEETRDLRKRFEQVQMIVNHFWKRFVREYVPTLTRRNKWQVRGRQLQVDDIVLLVDPDASRGKWNLGRILEVYPGKDGVVRNVRLRTKNGEYRRSVQRCCPIMEVDDTSSVWPPEDVLNNNGQ